MKEYLTLRRLSPKCIYFLLKLWCKLTERSEILPPFDSVQAGLEGREGQEGTRNGRRSADSEWEGGWLGQEGKGTGNGAGTMMLNNKIYNISQSILLKTIHLNIKILWTSHLKFTLIHKDTVFIISIRIQ